MSQVDPQDDAIKRFIVHHYRYDPTRRERRHVLVAAFDNEREFLAAIGKVQADIAGRRQRGEPVDPSEHPSGVVHGPGYLRRAANGHLLRRATRHGAAGPWVEDLELPSNMSLLRAKRPPAQAPLRLLLKPVVQALGVLPLPRQLYRRWRGSQVR